MFRGVGILFALAVAVVALGPEIEHLFQGERAAGGLADAIAGVAHRLHIEAHPHPVGAGLLHHRVGKPAHIQHNLGMFQGAVMAALPSQQPFDADLTGFGFVGPAGWILCHEAFAVVLVHAGIHALLGIGCGGNQSNPEAGIHGVSRWGGVRRGFGGRQGQAWGRPAGSTPLDLR